MFLFRRRRVGRVGVRPFPVHAVLNGQQPIMQTRSAIRASPKPAAAFMLKIVSWSTGHGFAWIDFLHSFFGVEKLPGIGNHTRAFARGSARLLIPNSEIENEPTRGFLGAYASGVWFSASRRKLRPQTFPPLELATRGLAASSGATPELTRETRVLPQLRSSG
jgi:hypothetical protein